MNERGRERETERDRERERLRQKEGDRDRDTQQERETERERQTDRQTERDRERQRETDRQTDRERERQTDRQFLGYHIFSDHEETMIRVNFVFLCDLIYFPPTRRNSLPFLLFYAKTYSCSLQEVKPCHNRQFNLTLLTAWPMLGSVWFGSDNYYI